MANKKFKLGMLVLALVFVLTVFGCDDKTDDDADYTHTFTFDNRSSVTVTVKSDDLKPSEFTINSKKTKTAKSKKDRISFTYSPADKVSPSNDNSTGTCTFWDK